MSNREEQFRKTVAELRVAIAAVDVVLFTIWHDALYVFLIPIDRPPHYPHQYGLPGGVIGLDERADQAAERHLKEKALISRVHMEQLYTFSDPQRDKRSRSISVAYMAIMSPHRLDRRKGRAGSWVPVKKLPRLAYDHAEIIKVASERLKGKLAYTNIVGNLLSTQFTLTELQTAYEIILGRPLDKRNFRKKMLVVGLIKEVDKKKKTIHRPAQLYTFLKKKLMTIPEVRAAL